ncbi:MAG: MFS transporter [Candidatus Cloacimonetes bacterium]|jgi:MFS transporter, FSR family, fosmidomycin resistance protein|nr:MFS transporter [Candidatus Cloacimonadota bacterium]MBT7469282.1 MFS transporter [Candidatus Cloacimonadota bacterium]
MKKKFEVGKVLTISFAHLSHDIFTAFLAPILPLLIDKLGISLSMAGLLDVIRKIPSLLNPFVGLMADRICVRYFIILTPAITAITMSLLGNISNYPTLLILLFVAGISSTLFHVPTPVMIKHVSANQTGKGMSYYMLGGEIARTLGPLLITAAISWWGLEGSWRVMPLGIIASFILYLKLRNISISQDFQKKKKEIGASETFKKLIPFFVIIFGITIFRAAMKLSLTLYLPTFLTKQGNSLWLAGISLAILQFSGAIGTFFAGPISDKFGRKNILLITSVINPVLMWIFISSNSTFMIPLLFIMGFFLFASGPVLLALVQDTNSEHPAFINGIYMTISFGVSSLMVLLIGFLGDKFGLIITYRFCAIISIASIPFILMLKNKNRGISK